VRHGTTDVLIVMEPPMCSPIFQVADYGLVGDLFVEVPELVAAL